MIFHPTTAAAYGKTNKKQEIKKVNVLMSPDYEKLKLVLGGNCHVVGQAQSDKLVLKYDKAVDYDKMNILVKRRFYKYVFKAICLCIF